MQAYNPAQEYRGGWSGRTVLRVKKIRTGSPRLLLCRSNEHWLVTQTYEHVVSYLKLFAFAKRRGLVQGMHRKIEFVELTVVEILPGATRFLEY